ncbi:hypothetical protein BB559_003365 [Furculomyces boomerangus]|uniref:glucan endo-1,3-beta-D-glucosidase n=2 Tax=Harpellales TaxID=61421 RepID=A0A2T9YLP9_9FUNG|nr:hypothetical protein BB559_003365 [Furculomyces boomerangus]PWA00426.1 hypothetical protein BB558_003520 [Smittium angustum]
MPFKNVTRDTPANPLLLNSKSTIPTNMWWSNLIVKNGDLPIYPYPYSAKISKDYVYFWYPEIASEPKRYHLYYNGGWQAHFESDSRGVYHYDDLVVNYKMENQNKTKSLKIPFVKGSPYISFFYKNSKPKFTLTKENALIKSVFKNIGGNGYTIQLTNEEIWIVFTSCPLELIQNSPTEIVGATDSFTGYIRFAYLPKEGNRDETFKLLSDHHTAIPVSSKIVYNIKQIHHNYITSNCKSVQPLMLALKHQKKRISNVAQPDIDIGFRTLKGKMYPVIGNRWVLVYNDINKIQWSFPSSISLESKQLINTALNSETINQSDLKTRNIYFRGKALARVARLAIIANELNNRKKVNEYVALLKENIELLFNSESGNNLVYDETYGGLITSDSFANSDHDFGNANYNDHYFHYGYYAYSIATLLKVMDNRTEWIQEWRPHIYSIVEEYTAIEDNHKYYTKLRNFDNYDGQSWASGIVDFEFNNNQESSSEAVNSYYGAYLLYLELGEIEKANTLNLVLTSEIDSTHEYYQTTPGKIYGEEFSKNYIVGILWEPSVEYTTWFGNNDEYIYGIQMMPYTPITFSLLQKEWLTQAWPTIESRTVDKPQISDEWKGIILMAGAMVNSDARNQLDAFVQSTTKFDSGNSKTNTVWWLEMCKGF